MAEWEGIPCSAGDMGSILALGRSPGEGSGNTLQCSGLENPMDRGDWHAAVHGVAKESDMTLQLNNSKCCALLKSLIRRQVMSINTAIGGVPLDYLVKMVSAKCLHCDVN